MTGRPHPATRRALALGTSAAAVVALGIAPVTAATAAPPRPSTGSAAVAAAAGTTETALMGATSAKRKAARPSATTDADNEAAHPTAATDADHEPTNPTAATDADHEPTNPTAATDADHEDAVAALGTDANREEVLAALAATTSAAFYVPPDVLPEGDGVLVRTEPMDFYLDPLRLVRYPAHATRIMYTSRSAHGRPIAVTGTVLVPTAPWRGIGERPVVGYAVGTQGMADECAPSRKLAVGQEYEGVVIAALLRAGYAVVLTDYEGLGTPGTHTYLVRAAQAHAVLDSLRAAATLPTAGISPTAPVALVGYSQGGAASAAAAELAPQHAPEIPLVGAYAGAVPADVTQVARHIDGTAYSAFLWYAFAGQLAAHQIDPDTYLNRAGLAMLEATQDGCVVDGVLGQGFINSSRLTDSGRHLRDLVTTDATLAGIAAEQRIGEGRVPAVPVLVSHSLIDDVVPYRTGRELAQRWCDQGATVQLHTGVAPGHVGGYVGGLPRLAGFLSARFAGRAATNSCWRL